MPTEEPGQAVVSPPRPPRPRRAVRVGVVTSAGRDKTISVVVSYQVQHRKYGKYLRRRTRLHAHDPDNQAAEGDRVEIAACRPYSKTKHWRLVRIIEKSPQAATGSGP